MKKPKYEYIDNEIIRVLELLQLRGKTPTHPTYLVAWLDVEYSERQIRRRLACLSNTGKVVRHGERGGYSV